MLIITHFNPDIDAICAVWLFKKFGSAEFGQADLKFVPAGGTYHDMPVDSDPKTVHVDTGMGEFDHHQLKDDEVCAASLVFAHLEKNISALDKEVLERLIKIVCQIDHFKECLWPEADSDKYEFMLTSLLDGLKIDNELDDRGLIDYGGVCLTGIWQALKEKIRAEEDIEKGIIADTYWGKTLFLESSRNEALHLAQKKGYNLVVRKDPHLGLVKFGLRPDSDKNLDKLSEAVRQKDQGASWYYHSSGKLLLNGSTKNPNMKASKLKITELLTIVKNIK